MTEDTGRNVEVLKQLYDKWHASKGASGDDFIAIMTDDIKWRSLAAGDQPMPFTAGGTNKDAVRVYMSALSDLLEMLHFTVDDYVADGDRVAVLCSTAWRCTATGKTFETAKVDVWRFRDGKAISFKEYYDTAKIAAAMTPDPV